MRGLFPPLDAPTDDLAYTFPDTALTWREFREAAGAVAADVAGCRRVAVWAEPTVETAVAIVGILQAGVTAVPLNPGCGELELAHILGECRPEQLLARPGAPLPAGCDSLPRTDIVHSRRLDRGAVMVDDEAPALIVYTSGTTGLPKGAVLSFRAVAANLDALAQVWRWTPRDTVVQALPLFHVHGLILGTLGPARHGSRMVHLGRFSPEGVAAALAAGGTMLFAVPTMYHRLANAAESNASVGAALGAARLLISGSAPLASHDRDRLRAHTGRGVIERYGLTETLMVCAMPPEDGRAGVGRPLPGVEVRLVDDEGREIPAAAPATATIRATSSADAADDPSRGMTDDDAGALVIGEVEVRGASLFSGYLDRPDATAAAYHGDWFRTGDTATRNADGTFHIVGRTSLDVIKTGGFKVGAGEVEDALRTHPAVAEAAVTGEPDDDLGQRIVAWVVAREGTAIDPPALEAHVARALSSHKRPRRLHVIEALPRNAMGKVEKRKLRA